jgi:poly(A) polymerase
LSASDVALGIVKRLRDAGHEAYFAGGCVRDTLLGIPSSDYDVATSALPDDVQKLFPKSIPVGAKFGVIIVRDEDISVEVATFRSETTYSDGRHPDSVTFTSAKEDVLRRDFTINGMLYDPLVDKVIDHVGGQDDLKNEIVRTIGEPRDRFAEDYLRMLRAPRFAARFNFALDEKTAEAIRDLAPNIRKISMERIREEIVKMLTGPNPANALELMDKTGLLKEILPEIHALHGVTHKPGEHPEGDVFVHTLAAVAAIPKVAGPEPSSELALAVLLHDVGKAPTWTEETETRFADHGEKGAKIAKEICNRLKCSNAEHDAVVWLTRHHDIPFRFENKSKAFLKKMFASDYAEMLFQVFECDITASQSSPDLLVNFWKKYEELKEEGLSPEPLLTGEDLIKMGYKPGPKFKEVLSKIYDAQLNGEIEDRENAANLAKKLHEET